MLITDDEEDIRDLLCAQMRSLGYQAIAAADGSQALAMAHEQHVDLILLDVDMPGLDGLGTTAALRADPATAAIPVILLTARTRGTDVAAGFEVGAEDYIRKPFSLAEVRARVATALATAQTVSGLTALRDAIAPALVQPRPGIQPAAMHLCADGNAAGGDVHALLDGAEGTYFAVVGDVVGHGAAVATLAAHLRDVFANHAVHCSDPAELLARAGSSVLALGDDSATGDGSLVTAACVALRPADGTISWALAGHPAPILLPPGRVLTGADPGLPLGAVSEPRYPVGTLAVPSGSALLIYTDGLTELRRAGGREEFGDRELARVVQGLPTGDAAAIAGAVHAAAREFSGGRMRDDTTLFVLALDELWGVGPAIG